MYPKLKFVTKPFKFLKIKEEKLDNYGYRDGLQIIAKVMSMREITDMLNFTKNKKNMLCKRQYKQDNECYQDNKKNTKKDMKLGGSGEDQRGQCGVEIAVFHCIHALNSRRINKKNKIRRNVYKRYILQINIYLPQLYKTLLKLINKKVNALIKSSC